MIKVRIRDKVGIKALVWAVMLAPCWGYTWAWAMLEIQASMLEDEVVINTRLVAS